LRKSRAQLRELSNHLHSIREEERARMARELRDELGQNLTALRLGLDWAEAQLLPSQERLAEKLTSLRDLATATVRLDRMLHSCDEASLVMCGDQSQWQPRQFICFCDIGVHLAATMALEMIGPMPGTFISRSHPASCRARVSISLDK
jgi:hypothetical protein